MILYEQGSKQTDGSPDIKIQQLLLLIDKAVLPASSMMVVSDNLSPIINYLEKLQIAYSSKGAWTSSMGKSKMTYFFG